MYDVPVVGFSPGPDALSPKHHTSAQMLPAVSVTQHSTEIDVSLETIPLGSRAYPCGLSELPPPGNESCPPEIEALPINTPLAPPTESDASLVKLYRCC